MPLRVLIALIIFFRATNGEKRKRGMDHRTNLIRVILPTREG